jgi:hypothetical protein
MTGHELVIPFDGIITNLIYQGIHQKEWVIYTNWEIGNPGQWFLLNFCISPKLPIMDKSASSSKKLTWRYFRSFDTVQG